MWRYRAAIPLTRNSNTVSFDEGFTPLVPLDFGGRSAFLKQDHLFPTGSFKDRGASVLVSKVRELGIKKVVIDSSGNAGAAVAAYCARAGIMCEVFVPAGTLPGKLASIRAYGAKLRLVPGTREDAARAARRSAVRTYYASHYWNPFFFQGTKTFAYEVCEQLGWRAPDVIVLPCGNGTLVLGADLGFRDLRAAKVIKRIPKIIAVQAANCAPIYQSFRSGRRLVPRIKPRPTLAEGIAIAEPLRGRQIIDAVGKTGGSFLTVSEKEIGDAGRDMGRRGFFIEPTAAATIAGLIRYLERAPKKETIVSVITGHGLKAPEKSGPASDSRTGDGARLRVR